MNEIVKKILSVLCALVTLCALAGCAADADGWEDGYYTAEFADFDEYGWKEFIVIYVSDNRVVTVEYNAKNESGFIKSWDMNYMRLMNMYVNNYPNRYTRAYALELLNKQNASNIDALSGATESYEKFVRLAAAVLDRAERGDKSVAFIAYESEEDAHAEPDGEPGELETKE